MDFRPLTLESATGERELDICFADHRPGEANPEPVAFVHCDDESGPMTPKVADAYARLFRAAPDLLAACRAVIDADRDPKAFANSPLMTVAIRSAEEAVRKALKGE